MSDNKNSLISIVVPVYNTEKTLCNCIKSILTQDYSEIEVILVNDGSSDSSGRMCDEIALLDKRIKVIHQKNQGVSAARNAGIEEALGEFLMFVDSDDQMLPGIIKKMHTRVNDRFGMVICGYKKITNGIYETQHIFEKDIVDNCIEKKDIVRIYKRGLLNSPWNKLYKLKLVKDKKIEFETWCSVGEDLIFNMKYLSLMSGKIGIINEPLYFYNYKTKRGSYLSCAPLCYDFIMRMHSKVIYYAKEMEVTGLSLFYEMMLYDGLQALENYYIYNAVNDRMEKLDKIKERIHDRRFKKLIVYLRKHNRIGRIKFWLLYNEWYRMHQLLCVILRRIKGLKIRRDN